MQRNTQGRPKSGRGEKLGAWLSRWGFALLVLISILAAATVAATVELNGDVPGCALNIASLWRIEVGALTLLGLYVPVVLFALALNNRAFIEIGTSKVKAHDLVGNHQQEALTEQWLQSQKLARAVSKVDDKVELIAARLERLEESNQTEL